MKNKMLKMYMYLPLIALVLGVVFVFTAEDVYRYACQDPTNWESPDCQPPLCEASGMCTKDLISNGDDILTQLETMKTVQEALATPVASEQPIEELLQEINPEEQPDE